MPEIKTEKLEPRTMARTDAPTESGREKLRRIHDADPFVRAVDAKFRECRDLLLRKHADYGPKNISRSPGGPLMGILVRDFDKSARIENLLMSGAEPANESLRDSYVDKANYAIIALLNIDGEWPE